ncbi:hypothetical protein [Sedimenticola hydrogenitrophicus]|uniref:hypothetical protein n=1 Tax=Sedimenticola hydrogenitrophicus TaxID=2967975 RepID=UPI0021A35171|nr:hypothetical protein [Sedimenticola hydrogenitrophicus]
MLKKTIGNFLTPLLVIVLGGSVALAKDDPPTLPAEYRLFETTWSNSYGQERGRVIIAINPNNISEEGKIWFPKDGTCTQGQWGTIAPGSFYFNEDNRLLPTRDKVEMQINGGCGQATGIFDSVNNRIRVTRSNRPGYTFFIDLRL